MCHVCRWSADRARALPSAPFGGHMGVTPRCETVTEWAREKNASEQRSVFFFFLETPSTAQLHRSRQHTGAHRPRAPSSIQRQSSIPRAYSTHELLVRKEALWEREADPPRGIAWVVCGRGRYSAESYRTRRALSPTKPGRTSKRRPTRACTLVVRALQMAPKSKAKAKGSPEPEPVEVEPPEVTEEALEAARQLKLQEKMAMRAAREAEVAEQTAKMNFEVKVNETVDEGRKIEQEIQEAKDLGLSPFKAVRMRRKSKELEMNANDLLSAALDKIFLECNCESKLWPLPRVAFRVGSTSP